MSRKYRLQLTLACALLLGAPFARAQDTEPSAPPPAPAASDAESPAPAPAPSSLPSADELALPEEIPESEVLVAPPSVVVETPAPRRALSIREQRRLALTGELGFNGIAGFGAILSYHATPHISLELGAGLAVVGPKVGVRARYNLLESHVTPFLGMGFMAASGWDTPIDITDPNTEDKLNVKISPSAFSHGVVGLDWTSQGGFTLVAALGYAWLLSSDNVQIVSGEPNAKERRTIDLSFRDGPVISIALGYSLK